MKSPKPTKSGTDGRISSQLVGAFGEKAVEAELLRRGWITANVNLSVKNTKDFDLFAFKNGRSLHLRVKTCSQNEDVTFNFRPNQEITVDGVMATDFTIIVRMGADRNDDEFYIVPTRVVREALAAHRTAYLAESRRDGGRRKDDGRWVLRWHELRSRQPKPNYGFEKKWEEYRDGWERLSGQATSGSLETASLGDA
jgi:hypothetical protein